MSIGKRENWKMTNEGAFPIFSARDLNWYIQENNYYLPVLLIHLYYKYVFFCLLLSCYFSSFSRCFGFLGS